MLGYNVTSLPVQLAVELEANSALELMQGQLKLLEWRVLRQVLVRNEEGAHRPLTQLVLRHYHLVQVSWDGHLVGAYHLRVTRSSMSVRRVVA